MKSFYAMLLCAALAAFVSISAAQPKIETRGIASQTKIEETVYGHLAELNGKFKLRASELTIEPGGLLGAHHHAGPGLRYVLAGEVTFVQGGKATVYKAGEYFFESGDIVHNAQNRTKTPLRLILFEILRVDWSGSSVIQPKTQ